MQTTGEINDLGFSPSFNCYSSESLTSAAAAKVIHEVKQQHAAQSDELIDFDEDDFEFSLEYSGEQFSATDLALAGRVILPIFNTDLVTKDGVDHVVNGLDHDDPSVMIPLQNFLPEESQDSSSSEVDEPDITSSGTFCISWRKAEARSPMVTHVNKSRSTGSDESGSKRWKIRDMLRRSNSEGKDTVFFLCPKRVEASRKKRIVEAGDVAKVSGKVKPGVSPSVHELFYVQKRAEQKGGKMKSYLPYRQDLLGFKVHVNGNASKKLPF